MQRFWTADFHLGMTDCLRFDRRGILYGGPFKNIDKMNDSLLKSCMKANEDDIIIHVGDLASFKNISVDIAKTALAGVFTGRHNCPLY